MTRSSFGEFDFNFYLFNLYKKFNFFWKPVVVNSKKIIISMQVWNKWISAFQDKRPGEFIWVRSFDRSIIKFSWNPVMASKKNFLTKQGLVGAGMNCRALWCVLKRLGAYQQLTMCYCMFWLPNVVREVTDRRVEFSLH